MRTQLVLTFLAVLLAGQCRSETAMIIVEERAQVYETAEPDPGRAPLTPEAGQNRVIAIIRAGDSLELLGAEYKKDYAAYRVRLKDGREGYLMSDTKFHQHNEQANSLHQRPE